MATRLDIRKDLFAIGELMSNIARTYDKACEQAIARECIVRIRKLNEIFIDIDDAVSLARFNVAIEVVQEECDKLYGEACEVEILASPSGKPERAHIVVTYPRELTDMHAALLAAALGDDPKRSVLTFYRIDRGEENSILFFEKMPTKAP